MQVHFNLRSLTRTLQYVKFMEMQGYPLGTQFTRFTGTKVQTLMQKELAERALFEGACMVFATQLNPTCQPLIEKAIVQHLCQAKATAGNSKSRTSLP